VPRDNSGNYGLPAGNPVVSGEVIESVWANTTMDDIAEALSNSLSRDGKGGMRAPLILDGSPLTDPDQAVSMSQLEGEIGDAFDAHNEPEGNPHTQYLLEVVAGENIDVDITDPQRPIVSSPDVPPEEGTLKSDGTVPMDAGYIPVGDQDIVTKKYHDDNSGGSPGGDGILEPDIPPVAAGVAVAYKDTTGKQAADPSVDLQTPTNVLKQGTHRVTSNGTVYEIETAAGGGTTIHIKPGDGGASLQIIVPAGAGPQDPIFIQSVAASLEIVSDSAIFIQDMQWPAAGSGVPGGYLIATTETTLGFSQGSSQGSAVSPDPIYGGFLGQSA